MTLKLFHITEFAESALLSPATQRESSHPHGLVLATGFWLAIAYNLPLWRELSRLPGLASGQLWWLGASWGLMMALALCALLSLLTWRRILKPVITLLLLLAALNSHLMLTQGTFLDANAFDRFRHISWSDVRGFANWQLLATIVLLAVLPAAWLWRTPVRRIPVPRSLLLNAGFFIAACALLAGLWAVSGKDVSALLEQQPQLRRLSNPFNSLQVLAQWLAGWPVAPGG